MIYIYNKKDFCYCCFFALLQKSLLEIEEKLKGLKPVSESQGKGKKILIEEIEDSESGEGRGENTEECERCGGDKSNVLSFPILFNPRKKSLSLRL